MIFGDAITTNALSSRIQTYPAPVPPPGGTGPLTVSPGVAPPVTINVISAQPLPLTPSGGSVMPVATTATQPTVTVVASEPVFTPRRIGLGIGVLALLGIVIGGVGYALTR